MVRFLRISAKVKGIVCAGELTVAENRILVG
jgi:hypothetical protein